MGEKRGLRALQAWCRKVTEGYKNVSVTDMSMSWKDGLAFCAIIHHFRPDLVDFDSLTKDNILLNNRLAFTVAEQSLGIPALLDEEDMVRYSEPDKLSIATYVSQYYQFFEGRNRGTASNNLHTSKLSMKRPFNDRVFAPQALPAKIPGVAPRGFLKDEKCSACGNRVYILERLMVDSKLYHRTCFTCNKCQTLLRPGAYAASDSEGKFECIECPSDENALSPDSEPRNVLATVEVEESKDSGMFETDTESRNGASELKLSNSFISARKQFFERSLEDDKPKRLKSEDESMKLFIDEGLVLNEVSQIKTDLVSAEAKPVLVSAEAKPVFVSAEAKPVLVSAEAKPVLVSAEAKPVLVSAEAKPVLVSAESKPVLVSAEAKPVLVSAEAKPVLVSAEAKPVLVSAEAKPVLVRAKTNKKIDAKLGDKKEDISDTVGRLYSSRLSIDIKVNGVSEDSSYSDEPDDLETPVNKIAFDFTENNSKVDQNEIPQNTESTSKVAKPPELPTSEIPRDSKIPNNESVPTEPPQKTPRKMKRLSVDVSTWPQAESDTSALTSMTTSSMSPTLSLPVISSVSPVTPLRKGKSGGSQPISKSNRSSLPPTELTSPEKSRKSLELKGTYQSPISGTFKWKSYEKQRGLEVKTDQVSPTKPKVPEKPEFFAAKLTTNVPTTQHENKDTLSNEENDTKDLNPFGDDLSSPELPEPPKAVKVVVKVKPARPPKPVIKESKPVIPPPTSVVKEIEYPGDLNPFGDEEEAEENQNEYPDDLNPFDDEEDQPTTPVNDISDPTPSFQSTSSQSLSKIEVYDSKLNPFGDSDDDDESIDTLSLSRDSRFSIDSSHQSLPTTPRSSSRQSRTMGRHKKRPAPLPPSLQPGGREGHHSDLNLSFRGSPSPSRSSLQGSLRGSPRSSKKAAPRPPLLPPPLASTPKKSNVQEDSTKISQDLSGKAQKEQNNKTMKELVDAAPDKIEDDQTNTFGYWKKKKRPAPSVPIPPRRQIKMIPVKEIQSELLQIEEKQRDLESQGRDLEMMIRDFNQGDEEEASVDEEELILQLFELVNQKNILFRRQAELMYIKRSQSLEQEQADIEYKYRLIASKPEKLKTEEEKQKEEHLLQRLIEIVELRNEIVESMDMDRQRVQDEDLSIQEQMAQRQGQLQERLSPDSTSVSIAVDEDDKAKKEKKKHKLKFIKRDKSKDTKDKSKDKAKDKDAKDKKEAKAKAKEDAKAKAKEEEALWKFAKKDKKKT